MKKGMLNKLTAEARKSIECTAQVIEEQLGVKLSQEVKNRLKQDVTIAIEVFIEENQEV